MNYYVLEMNEMRNEQKQQQQQQKQKKQQMKSKSQRTIIFMKTPTD